MDKNKSLGSSPIGYSSLNDNSFKFIRDLGVSKGSKETSDNDSQNETGFAADSSKPKPPSYSGTGSDPRTRPQSRPSPTSYGANPKNSAGNGSDTQTSSSSSSSDDGENMAPEKKIVSYYLEVALIERLKALAEEKGAYYSTVVSDAIEHWVERHGY